MDHIELERLNQQFETSDPREVLAWAADRFMPTIAASSSFQTQSVALLHMISEVCPTLPVIFIDTGYHFPETLAYRDTLIERLNLHVRVVSSQMSRADFVNQYGEALYNRDPEMCCYINKVEPMQRAIEGLAAWVSGIRRDQTANRASAQFLELKKGDKIKVNPLLNWTQRDVWTYINRHDLPAHPLMAQGYISVGCAPCTRPITAGEDERAGRWSGQGKTECGLHTDVMSSRNDDNRQR